jgi:calcium-dependent protein kinase
MGCSSSAAAEATEAFQEKYELGEKLGDGSFADVWSVTSKKAPDREMAVKIMRKRKSSSRRSFDIEEVAANEISAMKDITAHDHCVKLYESFCEKGTHYLVMERCGSTMMDQRREIRSWDEWDQACMIKGVLLGMSHLHRQLIMHRDINPKNVLLDADGKAKLCDFGFATKFTSPGLLKDRVGTLCYMSPEMLGDYGYTRETDVWSFGVSLYVLLFGVLPYSAGTVRGLLDMILEGKSAPQFKPDGECEGLPSNLMTAFIQSLLDTSRFTRCTSWKAMESPLFLQDPPEALATI